MTILAALRGGVDPFGDVGTILGLVRGLSVLQVVATGCDLSGVDQHLTLAIRGGTLIAVLVVGAGRGRRGQRRGCADEFGRRT